MTKTQKLKTIIEAIEKSNSIFPEIKGFVEYISSDSLVANYSDNRHSMSNRVSCAKLTEANAQSTIEEMIAFYSEKKLNFIWAVGPNSSPKDLNLRLLENGFKKIAHSDGLYLDNLKKRVIDNSEVFIEQVEVNEYCPIVQTMADGFEMPLDASQLYHKLLSLANNKINLRAYAAYVKDVDFPVGCSYLTNYNNLPIALLGGAATLPDYRNRGIYNSFLNRRVNDAIDDAVECLVILADQETSAPICKKYGFQKACESELYRYDYQ